MTMFFWGENVHDNLKRKHLFRLIGQKWADIGSRFKMSRVKPPQRPGDKEEARRPARAVVTSSGVRVKL